MKVVITGTSRGIGLELARIALAAGHELLAVARHPQGSAALTALQRDAAGRMQVIAADLGSPGTADAIAAAARDWGAVDVLVNNAGILRQGTMRADFMDSFATNAVAPYEVTQALLPLLSKSQRPRVAHITSKMGSIADNGSGGYYAYRASKAALNMISMSLARDHAWLTSVVFHPGWVQTDMGGAGATESVGESAAGLWRLIEQLRPADSGSFCDYLGRPIPW